MGEKEKDYLQEMIDARRDGFRLADAPILVNQQEPEVAQPAKVVEQVEAQG
jgi:hypothetical protein